MTAHGNCVWLVLSEKIITILPPPFEIPLFHQIIEDICTLSWGYSPLCVIVFRP